MIRSKPPNNNSIGIPAPIVPELGFCPVDNSSDVLVTKSPDPPRMSHEFTGASARAMGVSLVLFLLGGNRGGGGLLTRKGPSLF